MSSEAPAAKTAIRTIADDSNRLWEAPLTYKALPWTKKEERCAAANLAPPGNAGFTRRSL
jgi:hypothetical protein